jgi:hypothetical protein
MPDGRTLGRGEHHRRSPGEVAAFTCSNDLRYTYTLEDTPTALGEVAGGWNRPVGAYPHAGRFVMPNWQFTDEISPEDFASEAEGWVALGVWLVGGAAASGPSTSARCGKGLPSGARFRASSGGVFGGFARRMGYLAAYWERTGDDEHRQVGEIPGTGAAGKRPGG